MKRYLRLLPIVAFASTAILAFRASADTPSLHPGRTWARLSPSGNVKLTLLNVDGDPKYSVARKDHDGQWRTLIEPSALGLKIEGATATRQSPGLFCNYSSYPGEVREEWTPVFGKASPIHDDHNAIDLEWACIGPSFNGHVYIQAFFRVYDDGVAFRYHICETREPRPETLIVNDDLTEFRFADDCQTWSYNGEHAPKGPVKLSDVKGTLRMPVTFKADDSCYMAVLQAALYDWDIVDLKPINGCPTGVRTAIDSCEAHLDPEEADFNTPWHVIQVADSPGGLLESDVLPSLNPPCKIEDPSWIEPGLCLWDWRCWGATTDDGFTYDLDMPSWKRLIDFASENDIRYVMLDANWYGDEFNEHSDPTTPKGGADIPNLIRYAAERDVKIILYFNHAATKHFDFDKTLETYASWGAAGLKYGFLRGYEGQAKVRVTREIVRKCAEHKLLVDFHDGPIPPSGDRRTWPNLITREFCHAQSDAKRSFSPSDFTKTVFVNMLAGPLDMTNGLYDLDNACRERPKVFEEVDSTVAAETARPLIVFTGLNVLHDHGDAYAAKADMFDFIRSLPMRWDESRVLHGQIGRFVTMARRSGECWYIGSATNEDARTLSIVLDFLPDGVVYDATLYEDAPEAHYKTNREAYRVRRIEVRRGDTIEARMAPGGGHAIRLCPRHE